MKRAQSFGVIFKDEGCFPIIIPFTTSRIEQAKRWLRKTAKIRGLVKEPQFALLRYELRQLRDDINKMLEAY